MTTKEDIFNVRIFYMSIGEEFVFWLKEELQQRQWSQTDLAREAKISRQAVSNILNQTRAPGPDVCNAIATALDIDPKFVFAKAGILPSDSPTSPTIMEEIEYKIRMVPEEKLQSILDLIDAFIIKNRAAHIAADKKEAYKTKK